MADSMVSGDEGALESALARPRNRHAYQEDADLAELAAADAFGIVRSHLFADGNKRTGFIVAQIFLGLNGQEIDASDEEVVETFMRLADGKLSERKLAARIREHVRDTPGDGEGEVGREG